MNPNWHFVQLTYRDHSNVVYYPWCHVINNPTSNYEDADVRVGATLVAFRFLADQLRKIGKE